MQASSLAQVGKTYEEIKEQTDIDKNGVIRLKKKTRERGWDPAVSTKLDVNYVTDAPRSGRPLRITPAKEVEIVEHVKTTLDRNQRGGTCPLLVSSRKIPRTFCNQCTVD